MDWWLTSFFLGSILSLFIPIVPDLFVLISLFLLSIILFSLKPLRITSGLLFGASWMLCNAFNYQNLWQNNHLNALELASKSQWVKGKVLSLQPSTASRQLKRDKQPLRFNVNVSHINLKELKNTINIRLSWKNAMFTLQQGQTVKLKVKIKPAHGLANIGGFNYQTWLRSQHILATGYVVDDPNNRISIATMSIRQQLFNSYSSLLPEHHLSPLLLALGFGSRNELTQPIWQILQATGTGHLIAISGLHIGLVATGSYFFIMVLIRILPLNFCNHSPVFQTLNIRYAVIVISLIVGITYGYLAGYSLPTVRALLMLSIYWLSRVLNLHMSIKRWLLITLFLLTLATPFSLFTASFWLSVYAVTIIFLTLWRFKNILERGNTIWRFIKGLLIIQLSLTLMLLPVSGVFFQQISLVALFANMAAVPWMSFLTIPLCLLSVLVMPFSENSSQLLMVSCIESLNVLWHYLRFLSEQPWSIVKLSNVSIQLLVLFGLICVISVFFLPSYQKFKNFVKYQNKDMTKKLFVALSASTLLFLGFTTLTLVTNSAITTKKITLNDAPWQLVVFDVGQGLSVLIQRNSKTILYDTGASYPSGFNMVNTVILPYLQHTGVKKIDKVIISHGDNDHAGGLTEIKDAMTINELIYNDPKADTNGICKQGKSFVWQNLHFTMLWPKKIVSKENDDSCVLLISDGKHSVLLTGDISKKVEALLIDQYPNMSADILIVPHHGSKTSSSARFIAQLKPIYAVVSAGFLNRWHMPVTEVVERYEQHPIDLLTTAKSGQIIFTLSESGINKQSYYRDLWPFWFAH